MFKDKRFDVEVSECVSDPDNQIYVRFNNVSWDEMVSLIAIALPRKFEAMIKITGLDKENSDDSERGGHLI